MAVLQDLPTETVILVLQFLGSIDLQTVLLAQRVNRRFRDVIQGAVLNNHARTTRNPKTDGGTSVMINPFLQDRFKGLFNSADCFTADERARYWVLTLDGDASLPFRRLRWVSDAGRRDAFLRAEASWRGISPIFGCSSSVLRTLDVVKTFESDTGGPVSYSQVEVPASGLSLGFLYDVLLCEEALFGPDTGSWELLVGKSLRSFDVLYRWGCFIVDEPGESELVRDVPDAAVLYVRGGDGCSVTDLDAGEWRPQRLGDCAGKPRFLPWQGPLMNDEETEWFQ